MRPSGRRQHLLDTHQNSFAKLKNRFVPSSTSLSRFVEDLHQRGLLKRLGVAVGEFGRTPKIGQFTQTATPRRPAATTAARLHRPARRRRVRGGQVYGATNSNGGYVADKPVSPAD